MLLEERRCPNCGSNEIAEKNGTYACMNCRTFFDNPNVFHVTKVSISRDETEIERQKTERFKLTNDTITLLISVGFVIALFIGLVLLIK